MKIFIYLLIIIAIYFYILQKNLYIITRNQHIYFWGAIAIILLTAVIGIYFVRRQGLSLLFNAQRNMAQGIMPTEEIKGGIFLLISGLLLITPGFFTDCVGFLMFLKPVQNSISQKARNYFHSRTRQ